MNNDLSPIMKTIIQAYETIKRTVIGFSKQLRFNTLVNKIGRKLALPVEEVMAPALFKHGQSIAAKKSIYQIFKPACSYKTLTVSLNRWAPLAALILNLIMKSNQRKAHPVKHIDSTDIPVCLFKNAHSHKTMKRLAAFGRSSKGLFFGLKLHILTDLCQKLLSLKFTSGNVDDRKAVMDLSRGLSGIFVADAGYISKKLSLAFNQDYKRILLVLPRANMKKLMTRWQELLYRTRAKIEINFRNLKCFYGLIASLPRSVDGYLANHIYSLLAHQLA